ncbi:MULTISPECIES: hypothetical protein [Salegentibacter]|uniref:Uncharacterized protein n=1 Tax=Salegentibacter agarivorans TaxID=345907 RepID=A0A1I2NRL3_9FLAO|nr:MULTISPECIES: hypothetical protein [Salegentibacter]SFG06213.1 hypothetical protein SAMN04488033_12430 [Salegentibacter agarivorans]
MEFETNKHLLPSYFKIISFVIAGLALISAIISFNENLDPNILLPLGKYLFLLALAFFSFSKEKNEKKSFNQLRLKCLIPAIIFANIFFLFETFMELFKSVEHREFMSAFEVLLIFHVYYLVSFYYYKNKQKKAQKTVQV